MLGVGIEHYHSLLNDDIGGETQRQLDDQLRLRGLYFGDRALCSVLRPRFFSPAQYHFLQKRGAVVLRAFRKAHHAALANPDVLDQFGLLEWEHALVHVPPASVTKNASSRETGLASRTTACDRAAAALCSTLAESFAAAVTRRGSP